MSLLAAEQPEPTTHASAGLEASAAITMMVAGLPLNRATSTSRTTRPGARRSMQPVRRLAVLEFGAAEPGTLLLCARDAPGVLRAGWLAETPFDLAAWTASAIWGVSLAGRKLALD